MLSVNYEDVLNVLNSIKTHLIVVVVAIILAVILCIYFKKFEKGKKKFARGVTLIVMILVILGSLNKLLTGPLSTMLNLISSGGTITNETGDDASKLAIEIGEEGIVLLENNNDLLPLEENSKLNVFGWGSINPILGGAGSGALNNAYQTVGIIKSLNDAGITTNEDLTNFYTDYKADRPVVGMWEQDWTLPEPNVNKYSSELISSTKAFSDKAMIVISRSGGEGADLPNDMVAVVDESYRDGTTYKLATYDDSLNEGNDWDEGDHYLQLSNREEDLVDLVCQNFDDVIYAKNDSFNISCGSVNRRANYELPVLQYTRYQGNRFPPHGRGPRHKTPPRVRGMRQALYHLRKGRGSPLYGC